MSELKIVMMGDAGVGKSCITFRFVANMFSSEKNLKKILYCLF